MKAIRKLMCVCLTLVMCLSFAIIASAKANHAQDIVNTKAYGRLTGRIQQMSNCLNTKTQVQQNNDHAYLRTKATFHSNIAAPEKTLSVTSGRGSTILPHDFPNNFSIDTYNISANCTHDVYGGTNGEAYAAYTFVNLSKPFMK